MNETIIENYLGNIQSVEPEYMTEGIREFIGKFDKQTLKRTVDKLHMAFSKGDGKLFDSVVRQSIGMAKAPKYKEVKGFMDNFSNEQPEVGRATELSKKVLKNTFKIKDKVKLEVLGSAVAMTGWIKSKGGKTDVMKMTKDTLGQIHTKYMHVYDSGFEGMPSDTAEEEKMKQKMMDQAKKQEKTEMIVVGIVLSVIAAAIIWAGITIWGIITSPAVMGVGAILIFLFAIFKTALWGLGIAATVVLPILAYMKMSG